MSINELSAMLGYPQTAPEHLVTSSTVHTIGFAGQPRYTSRVQVRSARLKDAPKEMSAGQKLVMKQLRIYKAGLSPREMSAKTGLVKGTCNVILANFYKEGLLNRRKERIALTKQYVYSLRTQTV